MSTDKNSENMEGILRRINKLLALAEDGRGNSEEASAAANMAAKLMKKFQLERSDVILSSLRNADSLGTEDVVMSAKTNGTPVQTVPGWAQWIAVVVADANDCKVVLGCTQTKRGIEASVRFQGFTADVQVCVWTYRYLTETLLRLCRAYKDTVEYGVFGRSSMNAYRNGVASGIASAVKRATAAEKAQAQAQAAQGNSTALVLVDAKAKAIAERFGEVKYRETKAKVSDASAYNRGRADGSRVDVGRRAVGGTSNGGAPRLGNG